MEEGVQMTPSLFLYAVHGNSSEIIHILEENRIKPKDETYEECFFESIKCHHNELANYFQNKYFKNSNSILEKASKYSLKYHNFSFIQKSIVNESSFFLLCKYSYYSLIEILLKDVDINKMI